MGELVMAVDPLKLPDRVAAFLATMLAAGVTGFILWFMIGMMDIHLPVWSLGAFVFGLSTLAFFVPEVAFKILEGLWTVIASS